MLSQLRAKSIAAGSSFIGQIQATTVKLSPLGRSTTEKRQPAEDAHCYDQSKDDFADPDSNLSTVSLSDEAEDEISSKSKPGFLEQIKQKTENAGAVLVGGIKTTSESAGAAIVGGFKATTNLLTPLVGGSATEKEPIDERNDEQISEEFSNIEIEDEPEKVVIQKRLSMMEQLKLKTGFTKQQKDDEDQNHSQILHEVHSPSQQSETGFLHNIKAKVGLTKEVDGVAHESSEASAKDAHKDGFLTKVNPFASSPQAHKDSPVPAPAATKSASRFHHKDRVSTTSTTSSTTSSSSSSSSGGGITSVFDSITGRTTSPPKKRPEPAKQASFFEHITGKPTAPAKEPSIFDKMTGNTPAAKNNDSSWF